MKNNFDFVTREEALTQLWDKRGEFEKEDKLEEFEQIEKQIKQIPVLNLTVAVDLNQDDLVKIREKAVGAIHESPLLFLDARLDPTLIGGCVLIWKGQVFDYSVRKAITDKKKELWKQDMLKV